MTPGHKGLSMTPGHKGLSHLRQSCTIDKEKGGGEEGRGRRGRRRRGRRGRRGRGWTIGLLEGASMAEGSTYHHLSPVSHRVNTNLKQVIIGQVQQTISCYVVLDKQVGITSKTGCGRWHVQSVQPVNLSACIESLLIVLFNTQATYHFLLRPSSNIVFLV